MKKLIVLNCLVAMIFAPFSSLRATADAVADDPVFSAEKCIYRVDNEQFKIENGVTLFDKLQPYSFTSFVASKKNQNPPSATENPPWHSVGVAGFPSLGLVKHAKNNQPRRVNRYPIPKRIDFAHLEGEGIGYKQGYSKLGMMIAPEYKIGEFLPLMDLRGIVFNNGEFAANAGLVGRFLRKNACEVIGINLFYDFRQNSWGIFNQLGGGFEVLNKNWEFHLNGYFPISKKMYHKTCVYTDFVGDYRAERKEYEWGCKYSFNADFGYYLANLKNFQFYASVGPYFFLPRCGSSVVGVEGFVRPQFGDYLSIVLSVTYDRIYQTNYQVYATFTIPLYDYSNAMKKKKGPCGMSNRQVYQPVERDEIIMLNRRCHWNVNWDSN